MWNILTLEDSLINPKGKGYDHGRIHPGSTFYHLEEADRKQTDKYVK